MSFYFRRKNEHRRVLSGMGALGEDCSTWLTKTQTDQAWYDGLSDKQKAKNSGVLATIAADKENYNACVARNTASIATQINPAQTVNPYLPTPDPGIVGTISSLIGGGTTTAINPSTGQVVTVPSSGIPTWMYLAGGAALIGVAFLAMRKKK